MHTGFRIARFGQLRQREDHQLSAFKRKDASRDPKSYFEFRRIKRFGKEFVRPGAQSLDNVLAPVS